MYIPKIEYSFICILWKYKGWCMLPTKINIFLLKLKSMLCTSSTFIHNLVIWIIKDFDKSETQLGLLSYFRIYVFKYWKIHWWFAYNYQSMTPSTHQIWNKKEGMNTMNSFNEFTNFEISHSHTLSVELGEKKMIYIFLIQIHMHDMYILHEYFLHSLHKIY